MLSRKDIIRTYQEEVEKIENGRLMNLTGYVKKSRERNDGPLLAHPTPSPNPRVEAQSAVLMDFLPGICFHRRGAMW
jgi:hypothetical protein